MKMKDVIEKTCYTKDEKRLFKQVMRQMSATWEEVWEHPMDYRDAGAGVSGFIYYSETELFARMNIDAILNCLNQFEDELGKPLKKDSGNLLNWYAWFALEHIIDKVMQAKDEY